MDLIFAASLLSMLTNFGIASLLLFRGQNKSARIFGLVALSLSFWCLTCACIRGIPSLSYEGAFNWWRFGYIPAIFIPVFFFHFAHEFTDAKSNKSIFLVYFLAGLFLLLDLISPSVFLGKLRNVGEAFYWLDWKQSRSLIWILYYIGFQWIVLGYSLLLLLKRYASSKGVLHNQIKYIVLGSMIGWIGAESQYLTAFRIDNLTSLPFYITFISIGILLTGLYPFIITYAIIRYRLLDIKVAITRAGIILTLYALILGVPFYVGYHTTSWVLSTTIAVILATLGPIIYRVLQSKAENLLLAEQRRYQKILLQAASGMAKEHKLDRLLKLIVYIVKKTVRINFSAIFLEDKERKLYTLKAIKDRQVLADWENYVIPFEHPLVEYVKKRHEPFLYDELPHDIKKAINFPVEISLIVPSVSENNSIGFMFLGEKINGKLYSTDDINVFRILSHQTALAIENCMFLQEFRAAQEKIFSAEKLASIGGMAEGVAHQINNRLNHFSMAAGELKMEVEAFIDGHKDFIEKNEDFKHTFDYLSEIAESINGNVKRTEGVLKGILNYARAEAKETNFSNFSVKEAVDLSLDLLKIKHHLSDFPLELEPCESDLVYGMKSQLMECVYNLLDNGYEATLDKRNMLPAEEKPNYVPLIKLKVIQNHASTLLLFSDNGIGIKQEQKQKIFAPFFTTKSSYKSGTGIGMYVVKRMVEENHNGKIWFESDYGLGTKIFMELPKKQI